MAFVETLVATPNSSGTHRVLSVVASYETSNGWSCEFYTAEGNVKDEYPQGWLPLDNRGGHTTAVGCSGRCHFKENIIDVGFLLRK